MCVMMCLIFDTRACTRLQMFRRIFQLTRFFLGDIFTMDERNAKKNFFSLSAYAPLTFRSQHTLCLTPPRDF